MHYSGSGYDRPWNERPTRRDPSLTIPPDIQDSRGAADDRRFETYHQRQSDLVQRLQAKVIQYKARSKEMEEAIISMKEENYRYKIKLQEATTQLSSRIDDSGEDEHYEQIRQHNSLLRDQLEYAESANNQLEQDLCNVQLQMEELRATLSQKEREKMENNRSMDNYFMEEHQRILGTWKHISELKNELSHIKNDLGRQIGEGKAYVATSINSISKFLQKSTKNTQEKEAANKCEIARLTSKVHELEKESKSNEKRYDSLSTTKNQLNSEVTQKDRENESLKERMRQLNEEISKLKESSHKERETTDKLSRSLRRLSDSLLSGETPSSHDNDPTVSAIKSAFSKVAEEKEDIKSRLSSLCSANDCLTDKLNQSLSNERSLQRRVAELQIEVETLNRDDDHRKRNGEGKGEDNTQLEIMRRNMNSRIDSLTAEVEHYQRTNNELSKSHNGLEIELSDTLRALNRGVGENDRCHQMIERLEDKNLKLREELFAVKDGQTRLGLDFDVLLNEKTQLSSLLDRAHQEKATTEHSLRKSRTELSDLKDQIGEQRQVIENLTSDIRKCNSEIEGVEKEKTKYIKEISQLENDKANLQTRVNSLHCENEGIKSEFNACKRRMNHILETKDRIEQDLVSLMEERDQLADQWRTVVKQNDSMTDSLTTTRKEMSRQQELIERLTRDKEQLTKTNGSLSEEIKSVEKEKQSLCETLKETKEDKATLEGNLYELQHQMTSTVSKKEQLERDNKELVARREKLSGELDKVRQEMDDVVETSRQNFEDVKRSAKETEIRLTEALQTEKENHQEDEQRFKDERENHKKDYENQIQQLISANSSQMSQLLQSNNKKVEDLQKELDSVTHQKEEDKSTFQAEHNKVKCNLEEEIRHLQDKLSFSNDELEQAMEDLRREKRESESRRMHDEERIRGLEDTATKAEGKEREMRESHEERDRTLNELVDNLTREKDSMESDLKNKNARIAELDQINCNLQNDLNLFHEKFDKIKQETAGLINDNTELKRHIQDENDRFNRTRNELEGHLHELKVENEEIVRQLNKSTSQIKNLEDNLTSSLSQIGDMRTTIQSLEEGRNHLQQECDRLGKEVDSLSQEGNWQQQQISDLSGKLTQSQQLAETCQTDLYSKNVKLGELETNNSNLSRQLNTLQKKSADLEKELARKSSEFDSAFAHLSHTKDKLLSERNCLEERLRDQTEEASQLRTFLNTNDGRIESLENQLLKTTTAKSELENTLNAICTEIRLSFGAENLRGDSNSRKSVSPNRDSDSFCRAIRGAAQRLNQTDKERVELVDQARYVNSCLREAEEQRTGIESRLTRLQGTLSDMCNEKSRLETKLEDTHQAMTKQEEVLKLNQRQLKNYKAQLADQESLMRQRDHENQVLMEKLHILQDTESHVSTECQNLQERMESTFANLNSLQETLQRTDDALRRTKKNLAKKEEETIDLRKSLEQHKRTVHRAEERNAELQSTVDQLSSSLSRLEGENSTFKTKSAKLSTSNSECEVKLKCLQERLANLQNTLIETEKVRQGLQQRVEDTKSLLAETKRENSRLMSSLSAKTASLDRSEERILELENHLHNCTSTLLSQGSREKEIKESLQQLHQSRTELSQRVEGLQQALSAAEDEKRRLEVANSNMMNERSTLRHNIDLIEREKMQTREVMQRTSGVQMERLEMENRRLEEQAVSMQKRLEEVESCQAQRMMEFADKQRKDADSELKRVLNAQSKAEKLLATRDRVYKQRVSTLQEQVCLLKGELEREIRRKGSVERKRPVSVPRRGLSRTSM